MLFGCHYSQALSESGRRIYVWVYVYLCKYICIYVSQLLTDVNIDLYLSKHIYIYLWLKPWAHPNASTSNQPHRRLSFSVSVGSSLLWRILSCLCHHTWIPHSPYSHAVQTQGGMLSPQALKPCTGPLSPLPGQAFCPAPLNVFPIESGLVRGDWLPAPGKKSPQLLPWTSFPHLPYGFASMCCIISMWHLALLSQVEFNPPSNDKWLNSLWL